MNITTSHGTLILEDDAKPSTDDMNDIIHSVTRSDDHGAQFQRLCDASTGFSSKLTNAQFLSKCQQWVTADNLREAKQMAQCALAVCEGNHGGSHRLTWNVRAFECDGCLSNYTVEEVLSAKQHA